MIFNYPSSLPVSGHRDQILSALHDNQVIVIAGDTGSGKTTQIPKMCLEYFNKGKGIIGCTQPRRIAAQSVTARVKDELDEQAHLVGYKIRFRDKTDEHTRIKFMTDGVLLAETRRDRYLRNYDLLMIDEAHERSLNIDFILGHLKNILAKRKELKIIITSATIDTEAFSTHFHNAPVIAIEGTTYPVEVRYSPPAEDDYGEKENYIENCVNVVSTTLHTEPPGDMLVFLPTERDIHTCSRLLQKKIDNVDILPLFGRMQSGEQKRIFQPSKATKIVLATNVAETSITVPGIRYVIDSGLARIPFYNYRAKTNSLPIKKISQASSDQRRGRCGRIGPGICIRLFSEEDYLQRDEFSTPEIKRSNLAEVILQMRSFQLGDPYTFPFIDPPLSNAIKEGYQHLFELGAMDQKRKLTKLGRKMSSMPIDPAISRVIIEAAANNCLKEIIIIATVLAIQDPKIRPAQHEQQADESHKSFHHPQSDFLCYLNIWNSFHHVKAKTSWSRLKKFCKANFLSFQRMREWIDLHGQMLRIVNSQPEFTLNSEEAGYDEIHKSIAVGFLRNIAVKKKNKIYSGPSAKELMVFPGSSLFDKGPQWLIAASFLETNRLYALNVAAIQPQWLEPLAKQLCKYSWSEPRYHKKSGKVLANEQVSLFGLVIVASRKANYGTTNLKNKSEARKIFIQSALIEGQLIGRYPFLQHNLQLLEKWEKIEGRLRVRDIVVNEIELMSFYERNLPDDVYDRSTLNRFLKNKEIQKSLYFNDDDIVNRRVENSELIDYPKDIQVGSHRFPLDYTFDPAGNRDGVTVRIPFELYDTINAEIFEWIVPGLLREKTLALLKGLPKRVRRLLVPLNDTVDRLLDDIEIYKGSYFRAVERSILKHFNITIKRSDWPDNLPDYLNMRYELFDIEGKEIDNGRDFANLASEVSASTTITTDHAAAEELRVVKKWESAIITDWEFTDLPEKLPVFSKKGEITGYLYPAVVPVSNKQAVTIRFEASKEKAARENRLGLHFFYRLHYPAPFKSLKKLFSTSLSGPSSLWLVNLFPTKAEAVESLLHFTMDILFDCGNGMVPTKEKYLDLLRSVSKDSFYQKGKHIGDTVLSILRLRREVQSEIQRHKQLATESKNYDKKIYMEYQKLLEEILPKDFLEILGYNELEDCERYMRSLIIRISRAHADYLKDSKKAESLLEFVDNLQSLNDKMDTLSEECNEKRAEYSKMIQEYRISLFSPEIKTKFAVSPKKLRQAWQNLLNIC